MALSRDNRLSMVILHKGLQDEMQDLMDVNNEIQEVLGRSYTVPGDIDEDDLNAGTAPYNNCCRPQVNTK